MTSQEIYLLSNLATGTFIQLSVAQDEDPLAAARRELSRTQFMLSEQHGFFLSIYPTETAENPEAHSGAPLTEDQSSSPVSATSNSGDRFTAAAAAVSPLDAAAAQGSLDWPDSESETEPESPDQPDSSVPLVVPVIGLGLGSAGGH